MKLPNSIARSDFNFPGQTGVYKGKVRDVYFFGEKMAMLVSDRISAFDIIMPKAIPYKGQILNTLAISNLKAAESIVPTWLEDVPDPNVCFGKKCKPIPIEMVIRGYLAGHAWREYKGGKRILCGVEMPDGMSESQKFPEPLITPATKAEEGHDMDTSKKEILNQGIIGKEDYEKLESYTRQLFELGTKRAAEKGLILVDTKYEFGYYNGQIHLMDEIHTPDSSRYYYQTGYEENLASGTKQKQLSKEFLREWLMEEGFQGLEGEEIPDFPDKKVIEISQRYVELYENLSGESFIPAENSELLKRIEKNLLGFLED